MKPKVYLVMKREWRARWVVEALLALSFFVAGAGFAKGCEEPDLRPGELR